MAGARRIYLELTGAGLALGALGFLTFVVLQQRQELEDLSQHPSAKSQLEVPRVIHEASPCAALEGADFQACQVVENHYDRRR